MLPSLSEILSSLHVISLPMRTTFRGIDYREVALFEGPYGWGEFSPFLEYDAVESSRWLASGMEAAFQPTPPLLRQKISINATLPALNDEEGIARVLSWYPGAKSVKIKVGEDQAKNIARIERVRSLYPSMAIRLDFNGSLTVDQAEEFLAPMSFREPTRIEYVEQPCETIEELRELKERIDIKIAVDEVIRKSDDPFALDLTGAADLVILKVSPLGGIERSQRIASHFNLPVVVSSALESAVGITHGLRLAATLPHYDRASGLATGALFTDDVLCHEISDGEIDLSHVKEVSRSAINRLAVAEERLTWWQNRLRECYEVLAS